ncbi:DUF72 domain-containing protein [Orrella sp. JC864]|uniref:DUF72 domain-containing protein n=1 Tax=Orrella sp. JC864 TaxID=3120298 RepID=UPI00300A1F4C
MPTSPARAAIRIGISGWRYAPWRGTFYPKGLVQDDELAYASHQVPTIEINGSFYSLQRPERYQRWYEATPRGFVFSVKAPRYVTHIRRLADVRAPLANFFASGVFNLREKLGPVLWQLPPSLPFEPGRLEAFLKLLPQDTQAAQALARSREARMSGRARIKAHVHGPLRHALEVRHPSFADPAVADMLRHYGVALVVADTAGKWPYLEDVTAGFMYLRLHGDQEIYVSGYTDQALDRWAARISRWAAGAEPADARRAGGPAAAAPARDVYCYFDNDVKVRAPEDARGLMRRLGLPMAPQAPGD